MSRETDEPGQDAASAAPATAPAVPGGEMRPDPKLLELLVCPLTKSNLVYDRARNELVSAAAKLAFPIREGIPIMLESEARRLD